MTYDVQFTRYRGFYVRTILFKKILFWGSHYLTLRAYFKFLLVQKSFSSLILIESHENVIVHISIRWKWSILW